VGGAPFRRGRGKPRRPGCALRVRPPTACSAAIATMNCWRMPSVSPRPCPATASGTVFVALCVRTSSCAVVPDRARRQSGRHGAPSHLPRPAGAPRHQGTTPAPALSSSPMAPTGHQANAAHRLIRRGRPMPQGTTPAPVLSSPTAPTGHRANVVHRLGRRGCPVPQGTKHRTSSPALSSSSTAPAGHQRINKKISPRYPRMRNGYMARGDIWQWADHPYQPKRPLGPSRRRGYEP
jgi:hypothetical protein